MTKRICSALSLRIVPVCLRRLAGFVHLGRCNLARSVQTRSSNGKAEAVSVADAADALGVSARTVKRMIEAGELAAFRTRGGHLRISVESLRAAKGEGPRAVANPSSVLQNRRERLEELNLAAQELRAQRQLDELRRQQEEEEADRQAEEEADRQERQEQMCAQVMERRRAEQQEREERDRRRAAQEAQAQQERFVSSWLQVGLREIPRDVPPNLRLEVTEQLTAYLQDCRLQQRDLISQMVKATVADVLAPWQREQEISAIVEDACKTLPSSACGFSWSPSEWDLKAKQAVFAAIADLRDCAALEQIRTAANLAIKPVVEEYEAWQHAEKLRRHKAEFLDHWFLYIELSDYVHRLLREGVIELEGGETAPDVVRGLEPAARRHLDQRLTGTETREEVLKVLREFVRAEFRL